MNEPGRGFSLRHGFGLLALLVEAYGLYELFPPVSDFLSDHSLTSLLRELLKLHGSAVYGAEGGLKGYFFLACIGFLGLTVWLAASWVLAMWDLQVGGLITIDLEIDVSFPDNTLDRCSLVRRQRLHATKKGITAYALSHFAHEDEGEINCDTFELKSRIDTEKLTEHLLPSMSKKKVEVFEIFKRPLKPHFLLTFAPRAAKQAISNWRIVKGSVLIRESKIEYINEFKGRNPQIAVTSGDRPVNNVAIRVHFPKGVAPLEEVVTAFRIKENAATMARVDPIDSSDPTVVSYLVRASRLRKETLRFQWKNQMLALPSQQGTWPNPTSAAKSG